MTMMDITAVQGDITRLRADAIVNAANSRMRGGGGVDGAIHRAAGPGLLAECIERFPTGLRVGDAGWTTGCLLSARWIIHTVGPNARAGQVDPALLESCYRRSLEVADELGAVTLAFPLIGAGAFGWPRDLAVDIAVRTLRAAEPVRTRAVRLVGFSGDAVDALQRRLSV